MDLETPDSYATQFFGFTPDSFVESIHFECFEIINEHLKVSAETEFHTLKIRSGLRRGTDFHKISGLNYYLLFTYLLYMTKNILTLF